MKKHWITIQNTAKRWEKWLLEYGIVYYSHTHDKHYKYEGDTAETAVVGA